MHERLRRLPRDELLLWLCPLISSQCYPPCPIRPCFHHSHGPGLIFSNMGDTGSLFSWMFVWGDRYDMIRYIFAHTLPQAMGWQGIFFFSRPRIRRANNDACQCLRSQWLSSSNLLHLTRSSVFLGCYLFLPIENVCAAFFSTRISVCRTFSPDLNERQSYPLRRVIRSTWSQKIHLHLHILWHCLPRSTRYVLFRIPLPNHSHRQFHAPPPSHMISSHQRLLNNTLHLRSRWRPRLSRSPKRLRPVNRQQRDDGGPILPSLQPRSLRHCNSRLLLPCTEKLRQRSCTTTQGGTPTH